MTRVVSREATQLAAPKPGLENTVLLSGATGNSQTASDTAQACRNMDRLKTSPGERPPPTHTLTQPPQELMSLQHSILDAFEIRAVKGRVHGLLVIFHRL